MKCDGSPITRHIYTTLINKDLKIICFEFVATSNLKVHQSIPTLIQKCKRQ